jgi:hypothetical protein
MKVTGKEISDMVLAMSDLAMEIYMKANTFKAKSKEKDVMNGNQESFMRDSGLMGRKMAMDCGKAWRMTIMWDNGKRISHKALENIYGVIETNMKVNGKLVSDMDKAVISLLSEISMWANIVGDKLMAMVNTAGQMDTHIVDSLPMAKKKAKVIGEARNHNATSTLVPTKTTKNTAMENSLGAPVVDTKANTPKISKKATEKCTGQTVRSTEDSGMTVFKLA